VKYTLPAANSYYSLEIVKPNGEVFHANSMYSSSMINKETGWLAYELFDMDGEYKARIKISDYAKDYDFSNGAVSDWTTISFQKPEVSYDTPTNLRWLDDGTATWDPVDDEGVEYTVKLYKDSEYKFKRQHLTQTSYKPDLSQFAEGNWTFTVTVMGKLDYKNASAESEQSAVLGKKENITGLAENADGNWYLYEDGEINTEFNGLFCDSKVGWWLVINGKIAFDFNDLYYDENYGWWKITGGAVDFGYTDLYGSPTYGWWKVTGGAVDFGFTDLYGSPQYGWWLVTGGAVDFGFTDLYGSPTYGWWKINGGAVDFGYTDLYGSPTYGWWLVSGGAVDFSYSDIFKSSSVGNWKVAGGAVDFGYNGDYNSQRYEHCYVRNGQANF
jgi:aryl carrier-like protein